MNQPISGHVSRYEGKRRSVWRAKYRLPDGRQVKKTVGPAWTVEDRDHLLACAVRHLAVGVDLACCPALDPLRRELLE